MPGGPICPYCGTVLEKMPARKRKCPSCSQPMYRRTFRESGEVVLLREDQLEAFEKRMAAYSLAKKYVRQNQISQKEMDAARGALKAKGTGFSPVDEVWFCLNQRVLKARDPHTLKMLYFSMAQIAHDEGKDPYSFLCHARRWELKELQANGVRKVEVLAIDDGSCRVGNRLNGKVFTIERALREMPIPARDCSRFKSDEGHGLCACMWSAAVNARDFMDMSDGTPSGSRSQRATSSGCLLQLLFVLGSVAGIVCLL